MKYKHILVAIDLNEASDLIIDKAVSLAKNLDAKLSVIYVNVGNVDVADNVSAYNDVLTVDKEDEDKVIDEKYQELLGELKALCEPIDYPVSDTLVFGDNVESELIEAVKKMNIDLLIAGHHHGFWNRWWSSAHKLLDLTVVDLLLIRL